MPERPPAGEPPGSGPAPPSVGRSMAKGAAWMVAFKFVERGLGLVSTIILARLLMPADFGLIAMAMSVIAMLELLGSFSLDITLIQHRQAERSHYDTAWTFAVLFGAGISLLLLAGASLASRFYNEPRLTAVIYCLAAGTFAQGFENVGVVAFRKDMQFHKEFWYLLGKKATSLAITLPLAFTLRNHWALVGGVLGGRIASVILSYIVHPYRPKFSLAAHHELFHLSKWLMINNVCIFFTGRAGDFIIGKLAGSRALGLYNVSYEISNLPTSELIAPMNRAIFPGYAKKSVSLDTLRRGFLDVVGMIALLALPAGTGIAATASLLVPVFLGAKWHEAVPLIGVLGLYGAVMAVQTNNGYVFVAMGRPKLVAWVAGSHALLLAVLVSALASQAGALGAAWGYFASGLIIAPLSYAILFRTLELKPRDLLGQVWRQIVAAAVMYAAVRLLILAMAEPRGTAALLLHLLAAVLTGVVVYVAVLLALWAASGRKAGAEKLALELLSAKLGIGRAAPRS